MTILHANTNTQRVARAGRDVQPHPEPLHYPECGLKFGTQYSTCPQCGTDEGIEPTELDRTGTVVTYLVQYYLPEGLETPMVLALVELDDGGCVSGNVVDCPPTYVAIYRAMELHLRTTAAKSTA